MDDFNRLLSVQDLSEEELQHLLDRAAELKKMRKRGKRHYPLRRKTLALIFTKPSTRTRTSFEVAMTQLGGHAIYLDLESSQLGRGETIEDTGRTLSRYVDAIAARVHEHEKIVKLAESSNVPVINALSVLLHPCQVISDLFTIREKKDGFDGLKVGFVGDGNNVCNSLLLGCSKVGIDISVATPEGYEPDDEIIEEAREMALKRDTELKIITDPMEALFEADVVYTDVFVSMGQESERERKLRDFKGYQINSELMKGAKKDAIFMHCLPAHRGEEVSSEVIDGPRSAVFDQAENRLHVQKAILERLI